MENFVNACKKASCNSCHDQTRPVDEWIPFAVIAVSSLKNYSFARNKRHVYSNSDKNEVATSVFVFNLAFRINIYLFFYFLLLFITLKTILFPFLLKVNAQTRG